MFKSRIMFYIFITIMLFSLISPLSYAGDINSDFRKAAKKGKIEKVESYLKEGALVNSIDKNGRTALMFASEKGHLDVVKLLIEHGADISLTDKKEETALSKAVKKKKNEVIIILEFENARKLNTVASYKTFIDRYPTSPMISEAQLAIEAISHL